MGAKQKLNQAYFLGSFLLASLAGAATQSWGVFFLALVTLLALNVASRDIRL